jgi:hypothetical protein
VEELFLGCRSGEDEKGPYCRLLFRRQRREWRADIGEGTVDMSRDAVVLGPRLRRLLHDGLGDTTRRGPPACSTHQNREHQDA